MPALEEENRTGQCDLSRFTYFLWARLEGSLGEAKKQKGRGKCGDLDWRPALGTVAHLSALIRSEEPVLPEPETETRFVGIAGLSGHRSSPRLVLSGRPLRNGQ